MLPSILIRRAPPAHLSPFISAFVYRDEAVGGDVVRLLPETRMSVQLMLADPYWIREREAGARWRQLPRISLWAPRSEWAYGYAASHVKVYAFGLTPLGFRSLVSRPANALLNQVFDASIVAGLSGAVCHENAESFEIWIDRISAALGRMFAASNPTPAISDTALNLLASGSGGAVAKAAATDSVSPRQFRRRFAAFHGFSPKHYQRAVRVDRMIKKLHPSTWEDDPYDPEPISFADQPHAIREFREFTGLTPNAYRKAKAQGDRTLRSVSEPCISPPALPLCRDA